MSQLLLAIKKLEFNEYAPAALEAQEAAEQACIRIIDNIIGKYLFRFEFPNTNLMKEIQARKKRRLDRKKKFSKLNTEEMIREQEALFSAARKRHLKDAT